MLGPTKRKNANTLRHECRHFIQMKLSALPGTVRARRLTMFADIELSSDGADETVEMNYASYKTSIVARHGVRLVGWTYGDEVCNPGDITTTEELRKLHTALINKTCRWERVPQEDRDAIEATAQPVQRKVRSDKGKSRPGYKKRAPKGDARADKDNEVPASAKARAKKTAVKAKAPANAPQPSSSSTPAAPAPPAPAAAA